MACADELMNDCTMGIPVVNSYINSIIQSASGRMRTPVGVFFNLPANDPLFFRAEIVYFPKGILVKIPTHINVDYNIDIPERFNLHQNYPNPLNPSTQICSSPPHNTYVNLSIYEISGRLVKTLIQERQSGGEKKVKWNSKDQSGS
jgi:hypothetical protein